MVKYVKENVGSEFDRDYAEEVIGQFIADNFLPEDGLEGRENVRFSEVMYDLIDIIEAANLRAGR